MIFSSTTVPCVCARTLTTASPEPNTRIQANIDAKASLGILIISHPLCHKVNRTPCCLPQTRVVACPENSRLAMRRSSAPICMYSVNCAWQASHPPRCLASVRGIVSPSQGAEINSAPSWHVMSSSLSITSACSARFSVTLLVPQTIAIVPFPPAPPGSPPAPHRIALPLLEATRVIFAPRAAGGMRHSRWNEPRLEMAPLCPRRPDWKIFVSATTPLPVFCLSHRDRRGENHVPAESY